MKVTDIAAQQRRSDRYSVFVDGSYAVSLGQNELLESGLRIGDEVTLERLQQLEVQSLRGKALDRAYKFLTYRPRSVFEVRTYLKRKEYDEPIVEYVIDRLQQYRLLDDAVFASEWIENRQLLAPRSRQKLKAELREKGVSTDVIETAITTSGVGDAETAARVITEKRLLYRYDDERKVVQYLMRQGFSLDAVKAAMRQLQQD